MIRYALLCACTHEFDSWFDSSDAYDRLEKAGLIACPACGSNEVRKALMAPQIATSHGREQVGDGVLTTRKDPQLQQLRAEAVDLARKMREHVRQNAEDVGDKFAEEARKIHYEEVAPRGIYGKASLEDAKDLLEENIPFTPLPHLPEEEN